MIRTSRRAFVGALMLAVAGLISGCVHPGARQAFEPTASERKLAEAMAQRLEVSRHVAWAKFQNNQPVRDAKREAEVLASLTQQGEAAGLSGEAVNAFFAAQIRASRREQTQLISSWKRGGTLPAYAPWDLKRHIRPKLDAISREMVQALRTPPRPGFAKFAEAYLRQQGFSRSVAATAVSPLR
jgi:chorismate mutase-like protein